MLCEDEHMLSFSILYTITEGWIFQGNGEDKPISEHRNASDIL